MELYTSLLEALEREYDTIRCLKESPRGCVTLLRHRQSGTRLLFRRFTGSGAVYRRLLPLSSPHLPQILEVAEAGDQVAVVEEYVEGDTLSSLLEAECLRPAVARRIARELCQALWVLHGLGAVHRDVKPENVILRGSEAVLIDFDASRLVKPQQEADTQVLGTTGYAPPEQYGLSQTDGRADIYALGVLLNVMLTGQHPSRALAGGQLGRVVRKCTMMNPQNRYPDVLRLMEALG